MPKSTVNPLLRRLGQRIRAVRAETGISQEALADDAGVDRSYMSGVERGVRNLSVLKLAAIARALGVRLQDLLTGD